MVIPFGNVRSELELPNWWLLFADEKVLSVKEESEGSERGSDGEQDPVVRKWC